ncbi:MAG: hypothetical protein ACXVGK_02545, partial [Mycobacteriaceae bacterium]
MIVGATLRACTGGGETGNAAGAGFPTTATAPSGATNRRATSVVGTIPSCAARCANAAAELMVATSRCSASTRS